MIDAERARSEWIARAASQAEQVAIIAAAAESEEVVHDLILIVDQLTKQALYLKRTAVG